MELATNLLDLNVLQRLRDSGDPSLSFLRVLLELTSQPQQQQQHLTPSKYEEVVFHCASGFRHVALYRWESFTKEFQNVSRDFFFCLGLGSNSIHHNFPRTLHMTCLHTSVAFWKKSWCDKGIDNEMVLSTVNDVERTLIHSMRRHPVVPLHVFDTSTQLFDTLERLLIAALSLNNSNNKEPLVMENQHTIDLAIRSVSFLIDLVAEFSGSSFKGASSQQTNYNSSLETHRLAFAAFETAGLHRVLQITMNTLEKLIATFNISTSYFLIPLAQQVTLLTCEVLSWNFGAGGRWGSLNNTDQFTTCNTSLLRPPEEWRDFVVQPDFLRGIFHLYSILRPSFLHHHSSQSLGHEIRQLILLLSSVTGIIFVDHRQRLGYSQFLLEGVLHLLSVIVQNCQPSVSKVQTLEGEIVDMSAIIIKFVVNLKVQGLSQLPSFEPFLHAIVTVSSMLLSADVDECNQCQGNMDAIQGFEWRSEALSNLLQACSLLCEDFWLQGNLGHSYDHDNSSSQHPTRSDDVIRAHKLLSSILSPLYKSYIEARIHIAKMEEYYCMTSQSYELDDDQEDIYAQLFNEEMKSAATSIGRINITFSSQSILSWMQGCFPRVIQIFSSTSSSSISPDASVLLEEARLLILCASHLLTDEWGNGETPLIPTDITICTNSSALETVLKITCSIQTLMESQISSLIANPSNNHLSPILAKHMVWYFYRWAPAYICSDSPLCSQFINFEVSKNFIDFLATYCCNCICCWPLETHVLESIFLLLLSLAKRGMETRRLLVSSHGFILLSILQRLSSSLPYQVTEECFDLSLINAYSMKLPDNQMCLSLMTSLKGYHRMAYCHRAQVVTFLVVTLGQSEHGSNSATLRQVLEAIQSPLLDTVQKLNNRATRADHHYTREMVHLLVELYVGVAKATDLTACEVVVEFTTQSLPSLASLMSWYALDPQLCEVLLRFFRDYAENYISILNRDQSLTFFRSSAILLKSYSTQICSTRSVHVRHAKPSSSSYEDKDEEERKYNDVFSAIQLMIHIGSKDFIDTCGRDENGESVIDFVFYGLQQVIPLMTRGLLQYPNLALQYFSLVGFIMDVYAEKVPSLQLDLFQYLLESLLFGMSHEDARIAKSSLGGLTGLARELIQNESFRTILSNQKSDLMDSWPQRLLQDVVFQPIIWDRLESTGMSLLPLVVMDLSRFVKVFNKICACLETDGKRNRLQQAFEKLLQLDTLSKFSKSGLEGRMNRLRFKKDFEVFVNEIHSFLIVK